MKDDQGSTSRLPVLLDPYPPPFPAQWLTSCNPFGRIKASDRDVASAVRELRLSFNRLCPPAFHIG